MKAFDGIGLAVVGALSATGIVTLSPGEVEARPILLEYSPDPATLDYEFGETGNQVLAETLLKVFGPHEDPTLPEDADYEGLGIDPAHLKTGREQFIQNCMHCHGPTGGATGPTAPWVEPKPRNFLRGWIKFSSTLAGLPPTRDDIRRVLQLGVAYTAMPSFNAWSADFDLEAMISYVQFLMIRGEAEWKTAATLGEEGTFEEEDMDRGELLEETESFMLDELGYIQDLWLEAAEKVLYPPIPRPEPTPENLELGKVTFLSADTECSACHGDDGDGKGPNVYDAETQTYKLVDNWGNPSIPADLRKGFYRGGNRPIDLYRRIRVGIRGTPMPSFEKLTPEEIWAVVNYVYTLPYRNP